MHGYCTQRSSANQTVSNLEPSSVTLSETHLNDLSVMTPLLQHKFRMDALKFLAVACAICFILCLLPLIGIGEYGFGKHGTSCTVNWELKTPESKIYLFFLFTTGFILPLLGIAVLYLGIMRAFRKTNRRYTNPDLAKKWMGVQRNTLLVSD